MQPGKSFIYERVQEQFDAVVEEGRAEQHWPRFPHPGILLQHHSLLPL